MLNKRFAQGCATSQDQNVLRCACKQVMLPNTHKCKCLYTHLARWSMEHIPTLLDFDPKIDYFALWGIHHQNFPLILKFICSNLLSSWHVHLYTVWFHEHAPFKIKTIIARYRDIPRYHTRNCNLRTYQSNVNNYFGMSGYRFQHALRVQNNMTRITYPGGYNFDSLFPSHWLPQIKFEFWEMGRWNFERMAHSQHVD